MTSDPLIEDSASLMVQTCSRIVISTLNGKVVSVSVVMHVLIKPIGNLSALAPVSVNEHLCLFRSLLVRFDVCSRPLFSVHSAFFYSLPHNI